MYVCLYVCMSACLSVCLPVCLPACLSVCLPACLPSCLSTCLPVCRSVCLSVCVSACLYVWGLCVRARNIQGWWRHVERLSQPKQDDDSVCRLTAGPSKDKEGVLATQQSGMPPHLRPATLRSKRWTWHWDLSTETSGWDFHVFCSAAVLLLSACEELRIPNACDRSKD